VGSTRKRPRVQQARLGRTGPEAELGCCGACGTGNKAKSPGSSCGPQRLRDQTETGQNGYEEEEIKEKDFLFKKHSNN
jgi:hypothetical protein